MGEARRRQVAAMADPGDPVIAPATDDPLNEIVTRLLFMPRAMVNDIQRELGHVNQERARKDEPSLDWQTFVVYALLPHAIQAVQGAREQYERSQRVVLLPNEVPRETPQRAPVRLRRGPRGPVLNG